jgi:hypothetical protein
VISEFFLSSIRRTAIRCLLVLLAATYLLQMLSPLRLNTDAIAFLTMGESAASGHGFLFRGQSTHFPLGYPIMLAGLDRAGLGASWAFIGLNCLFASAAVGSSYALYRRAFGVSGQVAELLCALVLLCWVLVKHVTLPTSDVAFLGWTSLALLACNQAERIRNSRRARTLAVAGALVIASVATRTAGIALLPAFLWACLLPELQSLSLNSCFRNLIAWGKGHILLVLAGIGLLLFALVGAAQLILPMAYVREATGVFGSLGGPLSAFSWIVKHRLLEWGELATNVPAARIPSMASLVPFVGALALGLVLCGLFLRRWKIKSMEIFFLAYLFILLCWPYHDARFLLPVVPLAIGWLTMLGARLSPQWRVAMAIWAALFVVTGLLSLSYSTRISLSGNQFPEVYGSDERMKSTYRAAFGQGIEPAELDSDMLALLQRYERRARGTR